MSSGWFGRALASAKDAASKTQGAPGGILGGVLSSVAEASALPVAPANTRAVVT